jgi:hypothetical protein
MPAVLFLIKPIRFIKVSSDQSIFTKPYRFKEFFWNRNRIIET